MIAAPHGTRRGPGARQSPVTADLAGAGPCMPACEPDGSAAMTGTKPAARPGEPPRDLAARLFRVLYSRFGLGDLTCQISAAAPPGPDRGPCDPPCCPRAGSS